MPQDWELYGFAPVPRDPEVLFKDHPTASGPNPKQDLFVADDFPLPDTPLVREVRAFAQVRPHGTRASKPSVFSAHRLP